jgi:hypothetical protein
MGNGDKRSAITTSRETSNLKKKLRKIMRNKKATKEEKKRIGIRNKDCCFKTNALMGVTDLQAHPFEIKHLENKTESSFVQFECLCKIEPAARLAIIKRIITLS